MINNILKDLQNWYLSNCNGDWEHEFGIKIGTLDNPGWRFEFDLEDTNLENVSFERIEIERSKHNWVHCWVADSVFNAAAGPENLIEAVTIFLDWAKKHTSFENLENSYRLIDEYN